MSQKFSDLDKLSINQRGIQTSEVSNQLNRFERGFNSAKLEASATLNNGIMSVSEEIDTYIEIYDQAHLSVLKFVPASGAASRMFKNLFEFRHDFDDMELAHKYLMNEKGFIYEFFKGLDSFAFYEDLKKSFFTTNGYTLEEAHLKHEYDKILDSFLTDIGLDYGRLPKGLLKFHNYGNESKTPVQEHLTEGTAYAKSKNKVNIHFTVSPEHLEAFQSHMSECLESESEIFDISYSTQSASTDTVAATLENDLFRDDDGKLLFRPAGHGALLENINKIDVDVLFIKNIDNVVPDHLKSETIQYKKAIAGVLLKYQKKAFELLERNDKGEDVYQQAVALLNDLGVRGKMSADQAIQKLNRPIRVCGMVKNEGEPGGGPFWVFEKNGTKSLQIVESAQIDMDKEEQLKIFNESTHFNPVDLVCGVKDYKGEKFDLLKFRDLEAGLISEKSKNGKKLKAMELPGLWNGSMSDWNTVFVEVPLITFNPVKTVNDLLKENHH